MKKLIIILSTISLLLTGCGGYSPQSINMDDPDYNYEDEYSDYDEAKEYFADIATEAMSEINYDGYCQDINATNETECLETFRDELIERVYDAITDADDEGGADYFADKAAEAISEANYDGYCQSINATTETECLETFRDVLIERVYDAITD